MREIKFRAWDTKTKRMLSWKMLLAFCDLEFVFSPLNELILQQYIGLKDKKGKEIYEGDILKWQVPSSLIKNRPNRPNPMVYYCIWSDRECLFYFKSQHAYPYNENHFIYYVKCDLEVIGNIYENPELLEDKQIRDDENR